MSTLVTLIRFIRHFEWTPNRVWIAIFGFWLFLLTGATHEIGAGSPGLFQYWELDALLRDRKATLAASDADIAKLEEEAVTLENNRNAQEKEIRKTMGYVGENELIFDFSLSQSAALRRTNP